MMNNLESKGGTMERLTERTEYGIVGNNDMVKNYPLYKVANSDPLDHNITEQAFEKLAEYEDLEEQGLLLRLPIEAYFIKDNKVYKGWVQELVYSPCRKLLLDIRYDDNTLDSYRGYVGNTVFLTKEEAEQKLKEMESD